MTLKIIFGKNLKYYRHQKHYTQEQFAEQVELNVTYLSDLENGKSSPSFETIETISKQLGIQPYLLFKETENTHKTLPNRVDMNRE